MISSIPRSFRIVCGILGAIVVSGWLFYGFGLNAFLEAAYHGKSLEYFNEFAARWRYRQSASPSLQNFLQDARTLFLRLGLLGTGTSAAFIGGMLVWPKKIQQFVSARTSPYNLALFRILLFGTLLLLNVDTAAEYAKLPRALQDPPPGIGPLKSVPIDTATVLLSSVLFQIACVTGLLGLYTRTSAAIATVTGWYLLGIPQLYGKVIHNHHLIWFTSLLAVSPAGDVLSLDAAKRAWRTPFVEVPRRTADYALPLRCVWLLIGLIYFFPGFWKFANEGIAWALSGNLKYRMYTLWFAADSFRPLFRLDRFPVLYQSAALATMFFEFGFIFTLPFQALRPWAAGAALLFHQSTQWFMNIYFWTLPPLLFSLINLRAAARRLGRWLHPSPLHLAHKDEDWQRRIASALRHLDLLDRLRTTSSPAPEASLHVAGSSSSALWTEGRPNPRKLIRLGTYVPAVLPLIPFAWLVPKLPVLSPAGGEEESIQRSGSSRWPIVLVGSLLLTANLICGLGHVHSWPFSVYPTFAVRSDSLVNTIQVEAVDASGQSIDVFSTNEEASSIGISLERARGLTRSVLLTSDEETRRTRLRALWTVWHRRNTRLEDVKSVNFYKVVYDTSPPFRTPDIVSKTRLAQLSLR